VGPGHVFDLRERELAALVRAPETASTGD
jgi:hypothetical protein